MGPLCQFEIGEGNTTQKRGSENRVERGLRKGEGRMVGGWKEGREEGKEEGIRVGKRMGLPKRR